MQIKAGATLIIETGEYSDFTFAGPFRVLKTFDQAEVAERYSADWVQGEDHRSRPGGFAPWLIREGYIEDIPGVISWHVGGYGRFEPEIR